MPVSRDDVLRTAALARIHVPADRLDVVAEELSGILAHMEVLQQVTVSATDLRDDRRMPLRDDVVHPLPLAQTRESFAPLMRDGFFLVPRLQTHDDDRSGNA